MTTYKTHSGRGVRLTPKHKFLIFKFNKMNKYPIETTFMSNSKNSRRDPLIKNRIHFKFPETWCNSISEQNRVIGIRNMFITKAYSKPEIRLSYILQLKSVVGSSQPVYTNVKTGVISVSKFFDDSTLLKEFIKKCNTEFDKLSFEDTFVPSEFGFSEDKINMINETPFFQSYFEYVEDNNGEHKARIVFSSPFNELHEEIRGYYIYDSQTSYTYYFNYDVVCVNDDSISLFETDKERINEKGPIYFNDIWDRNACILFSNISEHTDDGYLGHTRKQQLTNIKYYEINNNNRTFWVDLFATCDHKAPVILPQKDELFIEAQLL